MRTALLVLCIFLVFPSFSATITSNGTGGGDWELGSTWSGGVVPMDGDDIIIAAGDVVRIDGTPDITLNNVTVTIDGILDMDNDGPFSTGNLNLNGTSGLFVSSSGSIVTNAPNFLEGLTTISVGGVVVWTACTNAFCVAIVNAALDPDPEAHGTQSPGAGGLLLPASGNPLPVEFIFFEGKYENKNVTLEWATASEVNNDYFEIERSFNATDFESIGWVEGNGNSEERQDYSYFDAELPLQLSENIYYRIRQVDFDGRSDYSITINVRSEKDREFHIRSNPFRDKLTFSFRTDNGGLVNVIIYDMQGRQVLENSYESFSGPNDIVLNDLQWLSPGTYILSLRGNSFTHREKIIKAAY